MAHQSFFKADMRPAALERADRRRACQTESRVCVSCGAAFMANPRDVERGWGKYCSRACQYQAKRKVLQSKVCEQCGAALTLTPGERPGRFHDRKYCSLECSRAKERVRWERHRHSHQKSCAHCGRTFQKPLLARQKREQFCSSQCSYAHATAQKVARIARFTCRICGGPARRSRPAATCSRACGHKLRFQTAKTRRHSTCEHCTKPFVAVRGMWRKGRWARFCSDICRRAVLSRRPSFLTVQCAKCGASFKRTAAAVKRVKRSFCGKACAWAFHVGENSPVFRGGKDPNRGAAWNALAETIRQRDGHRCRRCETPQGREKLSVDHVRPWRTFTDKALANHPDNLVSLCRKCHAKKTMTVERAWLKGDVLAWKKFVASLHLPSAKFGWVA